MGDEKVSTEVLAEEVRSMDPLEFEELIADLWEYLGYNTTVSSGSGDRGIDVVAKRDFPYDEKVVIQAKRWNSTVGGPDIREYIAQVERDDVDSVIVVGTAGFTKNAKQDAERYNVKLINGNTLADMFIDEGVVDLVREYTGDIRAEVQSKRSATRPSDSEQEYKTTVGEGEYIKIEVVGYGYEEIKLWGSEATEELSVILIEVENKSNIEWDFKPSEHISVSSTEGYSYEDAKDTFSGVGSWNTDRTKIRRDSKSRIALLYDTIEPIIPRKIEYSAELYWASDEIDPGDEISERMEKITVPVDESVREQLNSIPDTFRTDSAEVVIPDHPDF